MLQGKPSYFMKKIVPKHMLSLLGPWSYVLEIKWASAVASKSSVGESATVHVSYQFKQELLQSQGQVEPPVGLQAQTGYFKFKCCYQSEVDESRCNNRSHVLAGSQEPWECALCLLGKLEFLKSPYAIFELQKWDKRNKFSGEILIMDI